MSYPLIEKEGCLGCGLGNVATDIKSTTDAAVKSIIGNSSKMATEEVAQAVRLFKSGLIGTDKFYDLVGANFTGDPAFKAAYTQIRSGLLQGNVDLQAQGKAAFKSLLSAKALAAGGALAKKHGMDPTLVDAIVKSPGIINSLVGSQDPLAALDLAVGQAAELGKMPWLKDLSTGAKQAVMSAASMRYTDAWRGMDTAMFAVLEATGSNEATTIWQAASGTVNAAISTAQRTEKLVEVANKKPPQSFSEAAGIAAGVASIVQDAVKQLANVAVAFGGDAKVAAKVVQWVDVAAGCVSSIATGASAGGTVGAIAGAAVCALNIISNLLPTDPPPLDPQKAHFVPTKTQLPLIAIDAQRLAMVLRFHYGIKSYKAIYDLVKCDPVLRAAWDDGGTYPIKDEQDPKTGGTMAPSGLTLYDAIVAMGAAGDTPPGWKFNSYGSFQYKGPMRTDGVAITRDKLRIADINGALKMMGNLREGREDEEVYRAYMESTASKEWEIGQNGYIDCKDVNYDLLRDATDRYLSKGDWGTSLEHRIALRKHGIVLPYAAVFERMLKVRELVEFFAAVSLYERKYSPGLLVHWTQNKFNQQGLPIRLQCVGNKTREPSNLPHDATGKDSTFSNQCWTMMYRGYGNGKCDDIIHDLLAPTPSSNSVRQLGAIRLMSALSYMHLSYLRQDKELGKEVLKLTNLSDFNQKDPIESLSVSSSDPLLRNMIPISPRSTLSGGAMPDGTLKRTVPSAEGMFKKLESINQAMSKVEAAVQAKLEKDRRVQTSLRMAKVTGIDVPTTVLVNDLTIPTKLLNLLSTRASTAAACKSAGGVPGVTKDGKAVLLCCPSLYLLENRRAAAAGRKPQPACIDYRSYGLSQDFYRLAAKLQKATNLTPAAAQHAADNAIRNALKSGQLLLTKKIQIGQDLARQVALQTTGGAAGRAVQDALKSGQLKLTVNPNLGLQGDLDDDFGLADDPSAAGPRLWSWEEYLAQGKTTTSPSGTTSPGGDLAILGLVIALALALK